MRRKLCGVLLAGSCLIGLNVEAAYIVNNADSSDNYTFSGTTCSAISAWYNKEEGKSWHISGDTWGFINSNGYRGSATCVEDGGAGKPGSSSNITATKVIRTQVFTQAKPKAFVSTASSDSQDAATQISAQQVGGADVFINFWDADGLEGATYGINPSYSIGDRHSMTFTLPVYMTDPDDGDGNKTIGLDGAYKFNWTEKFAIGVHTNYLLILGDGDNEDTYNYVVGPYVSYLMQLSEKFGLSMGAVFEVTWPEEGDEVKQFVPGVNLGYQISDTLAANLYGMGFKTLDAEDGVDDFYGDVGVEVAYAMGNWALNFGVKTTVALDDYDSVEIYLGSDWRF